MAIYKSGTIINNRYEVVQGPNEKPSLAGGMGLVYLCVDHAEDGKPVALKTFRPELLSDRAARDRFLREGTTWMELGYHPHIVRCYQVFKVDIGPEVFFALELVAAAEGKKDASLRSWLIPNEPLPLEQALLFALHICRGMVHATNKIPGMVHRDLKPENILIGRDGHARVTDFGLASAAQNLGSDWQIDSDKSSSHIRTQLTHGIAGTPLYMAPEQWKGESLDERADIYALGCIIYEMLCGSFAFIGKSIEELKEAHCKGRLSEITIILPDPLNEMLQRCLALNRENRYLNWIDLEKHINEVYLTACSEKVQPLADEVKNNRADRTAICWSYNAIGLSYNEIGQFRMAHNYFEKVLSIAREERYRKLEIAAMCNLGETCLCLGDYRKAKEFYKHSLSMTREMSDRYGEGRVLGGIGNVFSNLGKQKMAIKFYKQSLKIASEIKDRKGERYGFCSLGIAFGKLGNLRKASKFFETGLAIAREENDLYDESRELGNLGEVYRQSGNPEKAIEFYEEQLLIVRAIGDRKGEGQSLGNMGTAYAQLGDLQKAIDFFNQHLSIAREVKDRKGENQSLANLGTAYKKLSDKDQALEFYDQHLKNSNDIGDMIGVAQTNYNLALLFQKEQPDEALIHAIHALRLFNQVGNIQYVAQTNNLINEIRKIIKEN